MFGIKCGAKARTNEYKPCRQPAMSNGKCRLHGGRCTGPKTEEGRRSIIRSKTKHGFYSEENMRQKKQVMEMIKASRGNI